MEKQFLMDRHFFALWAWQRRKTLKNDDPGIYPWPASNHYVCLLAREKRFWLPAQLRCWSQLEPTGAFSPM